MLFEIALGSNAVNCSCGSAESRPTSASSTDLLNEFIIPNSSSLLITCSTAAVPSSIAVDGLGAFLTGAIGILAANFLETKVTSPLSKILRRRDASASALAYSSD